MSTTELYAVPSQGEMFVYREFRNSHHGAVLLWMHLQNKYLQGEGSMFGDFTRVFSLVADTRLPACERVCLATTFDYLIVPDESLELVAQAIDHMVAQRSRIEPTGHWGHWPQQAKALRALALEYPSHGAAWNQTSVVANMWWVEDDRGELRNYDVSRDSRHRMLNRWISQEVLQEAAHE